MLLDVYVFCEVLLKLENCEIPWEHVPYLSASAVVIHYKVALYQVYVPFAEKFRKS